MRKQKTLHKIITIEIYYRDFILSIGESDEILEKKLKKINITQEEIDRIKYDDKPIKGRAFGFENGAMILRLKHFPNTPYLQGFMAHEIFHITTFFMDKAGMGKMNLESGEGNDEAYAYLCGHITEKIYNFL